MRRTFLAALVVALAPWALPAGAAEPYQSLARSLVGDGQGVFVQAEDGTVLAAQAEAWPVHPASVTKVATTLALLERLGSDHRFVTRILTAGPWQDGHLHGDLVVEASGDPFFVSEHAFAILERLHDAGLQRIEGTLVVRGPLLFNWKPDPTGARLRAVLTGESEREAWPRARPAHAPLDLADVALHVDGAASAGDEPGRHGAPEGVLAVHRSPTLRAIVKALNGYSNNVFHQLSDTVGGPSAVEASARAHLPEAMRGEVRIDNAAGAGKTNRLSPRAAVAVLAALEQALATRGLDLPDVLPVSGVDAGTLRNRFDGPGEHATVVGKTGTSGEVGASALVGVLRTRRHGRVRFAVLNSWVPVPEARCRQDAFVRALLAAAGAEPWPWAPLALAPVAAAALQ